MTFMSSTIICFNSTIINCSLASNVIFTRGHYLGKRTCSFIWACICLNFLICIAQSMTRLYCGYICYELVWYRVREINEQQIRLGKLAQNLLIQMASAHYSTRKGGYYRETDRSPWHSIVASVKLILDIPYHHLKALQHTKSNGTLKITKTE